MFTSAPEVRQLSFTGSLAVGRMLATRCAAAGKHATLELGGHAPFVVFADADLDLAAEKLTFSKLQNAGQSCIAANRVLVERPALEGLAERLVARVRAVRVGDGLEPGVTVGPLIDQRAVAQGARPRAGRPGPRSARPGRGRARGRAGSRPLLRPHGPRRRAARRAGGDGGDVRPRGAAHPVRHRGGGDRRRQRLGVRPRRLPLHARPRPRAPRRRGAGLRHGRRSTTARWAGCRRRSAGSRARATRARAAGSGSRTTSTCST